MNIKDMTDALFNKEMNQLLNRVTFFCNTLSNTGIFSLTAEPMDNSQTFPLAIELKKVWDYARGTDPKPSNMNEVMQTLYKLLWSSIGNIETPKIPNYWWDEPLGFMCSLAIAREMLDKGEPINAKQLSILSGYTHTYIKRSCTSSKIKATKVKQDRSSQLEWAISADEARLWMER